MFVTFYSFSNFICFNCRFSLLGSYYTVFVSYSLLIFVLSNTDPFWQALFVFFVLFHIVLQVFMQHWDRGISSRLQRVSAPVRKICEVSVHSENMDPLPEEQ